MNAHWDRAPSAGMISAADRVATPAAGLVIGLPASGAFRPLRAAVFCALLLSACSLFALTSASALADARIGASVFPAGAEAGGVQSIAGVAVSAKEGGDLYVPSGSYDQRVDQFTPAGTFVRAFGAGVVPGAASGTGDLTAGSTIITDVDTTAGAFLDGEYITGPGVPTGTTIVRGGGGLEEFNDMGTLTLSNPAEASATDASLSVAAGPGNVPTDERQRLTVEATAGQFTLSFTSPEPSRATESTAAIPFNATAAEVQAVLEALADIGAGNVTVSLAPAGNPGGELEVPGGPWIVEFGGSRYADTDVSPLAPDSTALSGGAHEATVLTVQPGAQALETCTTVCDLGARGSAPGQLDWSDEISVDNDPGTLAEPNPSYGDVYVVDQRNFRVEKFSPTGEFLLMFGGDVDKTTGADVCTAEDIEVHHDTCGAGAPGTGPAHFYEEDPPTGGGGSFAIKTWSKEGDNSIAVGPEGKVYVGDYGRIQEFGQDGTFLGQFVPPVGAGEEPQFVASLALDAAGDLYERSVTQYRDGSPNTEVRGVREYNTESPRQLVRTFDAGSEEAGSEPTHIALDQAGDLFVSDLNGQGEDSVQFRAFKPDGSLYAIFASTEAPRALGIALGDGHLYATTRTGEEYVAVLGVPIGGPPVVSAEHATSLEPTTATLNATVNPKQFDTTYRFQYTTSDFADCDTPANSACHTVIPAEPDLGSIDQEYSVQAAVSDLAPATSYRWRVVAENECNGPSPEPVCETTPESTFETLPQVSVRNFATLTVAPEEVVIEAELNPNNGSAGHYEICYGAEAGHTLGCAAGNIPLGSEFIKVSEGSKEGVAFTHLQPDTTYHYWLIAKDSYPGEFETADQTFTTEPSAAEEHQAELAECPNVLLREEDGSTALSDCRAYEQISPAFKNAYPVSIAQFLAPSGEREYFASAGSFAGAETNRGYEYYFARRTPQGWVTKPAIGPAAGTESQASEPVEFSAALDSALFTSLPGSNSEAAGLPGAGSPTLYYAAPDGSYLPASPTLTPVDPIAPTNFDLEGQSSDLSRVVIATNHKLLPSDPLPDSEIGTFNRLYEISGVGSPDPAISLVAEVPSSLPENTSCAISTPIAFGQATDPLSADGSTLFYEVPLAISPCEGGPTNKYALFARPFDGPAVELSSPSSSCGPCASAATQSAHFYGSSPDGDLAWFTTTQPLLSSDLDPTEGESANDLYLVRLQAGQPTGLVQASAGDATDPSPGEGAGVKGVVRISQSGEVAAFVATGVLTTEPDPTTGQSATQGADNLYLYDAESGVTKFVAEVCSGPETSAATPDSACPADLEPGAGNGRNDGRLWTTQTNNSEPGVSEAHLTPDGRYLLFDSYGRLTAGDTDNAKDVYRYDLSTGQLIRISIGRDGNDANGNDDRYDAEIAFLHLDQLAYLQAEDGERSISTDGSEVIFVTPAPLVSSDTNAGASPGCGEHQEATGCDVYEWQESGHGACREAGGCVRLISSGLDPHSISAAVISSSGRDIAFVTSRSLLSADTDGVADVYDAREGGGFPPAHLEPPCGGAETCHGPASLEPVPPRITTESPTRGNGPSQLRCARGKVRVKKHGQVRCVAKKHHKKNHTAQHRHNAKHHKRAGSNHGGHK